MKLRSFTPLKLFALLLFSLEFVAPALLSDGIRYNSTFATEKLSSSSSNQHLPFSIVLLELSENQEGKQVERDFFFLKEHTLPNHSKHLVESDRIISSSFVASLKQFNSHPPLFQTQRKLLI